MASGAEYFLKKTLGEDFMESLAKVELWKPGTKSTIDHEELRTALQIVPRTVMALLIRELATLNVGQNKRVELFVSSGAFLNVTKHERDVYSGDIEQGGKRLTEFKLRSLPGIGLVIMSTFELYDMENLINSPTQNPQVPTPPVPPISDDISHKVQSLIDERLALYDLVGKVVDKKIMEREAIHQLFLRQLSEITKIAKQSSESGPYFQGMANGLEVANSVGNKKEPEFVEAPKKKRSPVQDFLDARKNKIKKTEYIVHLSKGEVVTCPDCRQNIFDGTSFSGCICLGDDMQKKVFIKKSEEGIKVRFSKGWDKENIEMLLEVLRRKHG